MSLEIKVNRESKLSERECVLAGLKATFPYEDLRYIANGLEKYLSPEVPWEEAARPAITVDSPVAPYPRKAPGFGG